MKIFISHKKEDTQDAEFVSKIMKRCNVDFYLDTMDTHISGDGKELTSHIQNSLKECTDILVIISKTTYQSWWVPFEIGIASANQFPIVSFIVNYANGFYITLPEYLEYWPQLRGSYAIYMYIEEIRKRREKEKRHYYTKNFLINSFYENLKSKVF